MGNVRKLTNHKSKQSMHPFGTVIRVLVCFDTSKISGNFGIDLGVGIDLSACVVYR